jgi:hypothetical protein
MADIGPSRPAAIGGVQRLAGRDTSVIGIDATTPKDFRDGWSCFNAYVRPASSMLRLRRSGKNLCNRLLHNYLEKGVPTVFENSSRPNNGMTMVGLAAPNFNDVPAAHVFPN